MRISSAMLLGGELAKREMEMNCRSILVRAFELARTGDYSTVAEVERALMREGYSLVEMHLRGPSIRRQLRDLCRETAAARSVLA